MHPCPGCGFKNRPDRDSCLKCGQVFREQKDLKPLLQKIGSAVLGVVLVGIALIKIFGPSKMELKRQRYEEREARKTESARAAEAPKPEPPAQKTAPVEPPPARKEPEEPSREERGAAHLRRADDLYGKGDYTGAAAAYKEAAALGIQSPQSQARKKILADISYIVMYRDYLDRENILDTARLVSARANLERIDGATLPTDELREQLRTTLARATKAYKELIGEEERSSPAPSPPKPPPGPAWRIPDAGWKDTFLMKPVDPDKGKIQGSAFTKVVADSLVWKAGLREGDVMIEFNGEPVTTMNQMINLKTRIEKDRGFWGVVRRGDQKIPFRVEFPAGR